MTAAATASISLTSEGEATAAIRPVTAVTPAAITGTAKHFEITYKSWSVDGDWGFDYNSADNHLRGYGSLAGDCSGDSCTHFEMNPLRLGDRNGVLAEAIGHSTDAWLQLETPAVSCHYPDGVYISDMYFSIRWPDGHLTSNQSTGQFEKSANDICVS